MRQALDQPDALVFLLVRSGSRHHDGGMACTVFCIDLRASCIAGCVLHPPGLGTSLSVSYRMPSIHLLESIFSLRTLTLLCAQGLNDDLTCAL